MSFKAIDWARNQPIKPTLKAILIALAIRANDNHQCFPSFECVSQDTSFSRRTVIRSISKLEALGLIEKEHRYRAKDNGNTSNLYTLSVFAVSLVETSAINDIVSPHLVTTCHSPSDNLTPKNNKIKNILKENNNSTTENQPIYEPIVVVSEKIVTTAEQTTDSFKPVPDMTALEKMDEKDKQAAIGALKKVPDTTIQAVILFRLKKAITSGVIQQTALIYLCSLIGKAKNGSLDVRSELISMKKAQEAAKPKQSTAINPPRNDKADRLALLRHLVIKHPEAIIQAQQQGCCYVGGYGMFIKKDFEEAGLIV